MSNFFSKKSLMNWCFRAVIVLLVAVIQLQYSCNAGAVIWRAYYAFSSSCYGTPDSIAIVTTHSYSPCSNVYIQSDCITGSYDAYIERCVDSSITDSTNPTLLPPFAGQYIDVRQLSIANQYTSCTRSLYNTYPTLLGFFKNGKCVLSGANSDTRLWKSSATISGGVATFYYACLTDSCSNGGCYGNTPFTASYTSSQNMYCSSASSSSRVIYRVVDNYNPLHTTSHPLPAMDLTTLIQTS